MLCKCSGKYIDIYFILKITFHLVLPITGFAYSWSTLWIYAMDFVKDLPTSAPASSASSSSATATDVSAYRSCGRCAFRMSSILYDKHTLCLNCRDVQCSLDVRCDECKN